MPSVHVSHRPGQRSVDPVALADRRALEVARPIRADDEQRRTVHITTQVHVNGLEQGLGRAEPLGQRAPKRSRVGRPRATATLGAYLGTDVATLEDQRVVV